jgi:hypothetical protein
MADLKRVMPPGRKPDRWLPASIAIVTVVVLLAIAKPWGRGLAPQTAFPSGSIATPAASRPAAGRGRYDPALFGQDAPDPAWQLWPAGYVVDFGLAGPVTMGTGPSAALSPAASRGRPPAASPSRTPTYGSLDPIRIGQADNLVVLGINTPADVDVVQFRLSRLEGSRSVVVPIVVLAAPWPVHYFHVIGIESPDASNVLGPWRAGVYRLELIGGDGMLIRTVVVSIDAPSAPRGSPSPGQG